MNWGRILIVTLAVFCITLGIMIYGSTRLTRTDLVSKEYEKEQINYQATIEAMQRARKIHPFKVATATPFIVLELPKEQQQQRITGEAFFYCAYNADLDQTVQLVTDKLGQQMIPLSWMKAKKYTLKLTWTDGRQNYYTEKPFDITE